MRRNWDLKGTARNDKTFSPGLPAFKGVSVLGLKLFFQSLLFLPGTFLHEFAHFSVALVLGKARGFSLWPRTSGDKLIFGNVSASVRYMVLHAFIAAAPLVWWVALYFLLQYVGLIKFVYSLPGMSFDQITKTAGSISPTHLVLVWLIFQLLWAGWPSTQDMKNFLKGVFSVSGVILMLAGTAVYLLLKTA